MQQIVDEVKFKSINGSKQYYKNTKMSLRH